MTQKEYHHAWYEANKARLKETYRQNYLKRKAENPEAVRAERRRSSKLWKLRHPEKVAAYNASEEGRKVRRESNAKWRSENPELVKQQRRDAMRRAYEANPEKYKSRAKAWRENNPERAAQIAQKKCRKRLHLFRAYYQNRLDTDPNFKMAATLRGRLKKALKRGQKSGSAIELLGCSIPEFWIYLESKFEEGMTRENHGSVWHVDHIIPCALFDLTKPEHQKRCFQFSNLQPLFAIDNLRKGTKHKEKVQ